MFNELTNDTLELTDDELTEVTGNGGSLGSCGVCGGGFGGFGGFATIPFVAAFTNQNANTFATTASLALSNANQNSFFTQFG